MKNIDKIQIDLLRAEIELFAAKYNMTFEEVINELKRIIEYREKKLVNLRKLNKGIKDE